MIRVLFIGDVCGKPGRKALSEIVPGLRSKYDIDLVMTNVENIAHGRGATVSTIQEAMASGVDFMTAGNHIWRNPQFEDVLSGEFPVIRPINYPRDLPGKGYGEIDLGPKGIFLVISVMGVAFFYQERTLSEPFRALDEFLDNIDIDSYAGILVDFHAEATGEKLSAGLYLDGRVSAVLGTHTHVPTADERILNNGTAYITDVGMTGPLDSVLWVKKEIIFAQNKYPYSPGYEIQEEGPLKFDAVLIDIDGPRKALGIKRINKIL
jgi:metallophosphoesterase (TIGR00282 family)